MFNYQNKEIMSEKGREKRTGHKRTVNVWLAAGAIVLIVLLLLWLTLADFMGDTDVAAFIAPMLL